ncbi:MAG: Ig-like domain-containing protein [Thermoleophilaceae bacterium]
MRLRSALIPLACLALAAPAAASAGARHQGAVAALHKAEAVRLGKGRARGTELTPLLKELSNRLRFLHGGERRRAERLMMRPTAGQGQVGEETYAVPEAPQSPYCSPHACVHWVAVNTRADRDAPPLTDSDLDGVPDYVETASEVMEHVHAVENDEMHWREPVGDGSRGGDFNKTDVYLKQIGDDGIYGYSTPDPNQKGSSQFAYLVLDNDFKQAEFPAYSNPVLPMEVTAAHEYNHILQFGYDWLQDTWMFEATAVWAEDKVYDSVNDYVSYLNSWAHLTQVPLTTFDALDFSDPVNNKVYGDAVWVRWLDAHFGQDVVRSAWEHSLDSNPPSFAPGAFNRALLDRGSSFFSAFTRFAADTAEWRSAAGAFEEGPTWPDVRRVTKQKTLKVGARVSGTLDHTAYALHDVSPHGAKRIRLVGKLPHGVAGAFALVGRTGPQTSGAVEVHLKRLPNGGRARVTVDKPTRFSRLTAVLINAAVGQDGFKPELGDWDFSRSDAQPVSALITKDFAPPRVLDRDPKPDTREVSRLTDVSMQFSEPVRGVSTRTLKLIGPDGHKVNARVRYDGHRRRARLEPKERLRRHTGYEVKLTGGIVDGGGNGVPDSQRTWTFRTHG